MQIATCSNLTLSILILVLLIHNRLLQVQGRSWAFTWVQFKETKREWATRFWAEARTHKGAHTFLISGKLRREGGGLVLRGCLVFDSGGQTSNQNAKG